MTLTLYRHFQRNGGLNQILRRQISRFHYGSNYVIFLQPPPTVFPQNENVGSWCLLFDYNKDMEILLIFPFLCLLGCYIATRLTSLELSNENVAPKSFPY